MNRESLDSGLELCQHEPSDFTSARIPAAAMLHQHMDFAAAWVRREGSSSASRRRQMLLLLALPHSVEPLFVMGRCFLSDVGPLHARSL